MTQDQVVSLMKTSRSKAEWNRNCDQVKKAHGGKYPDYWYSAIVLSGIANDVQSKWS